MVIAFWSLYPGMCGVSSNIMAMASYAADQINAEASDRVALLQTQFKDSGLDFPMLGKGVLKDDFFGTGMDALLTRAQASYLSQDDVFLMSISMIEGKLLFYMGTKEKNSQSYKRSMKRFPNVMKGVDEYAHQVYIDVESGNTELAKQILPRADLVVINICQNERVISRTLDEIEHLNLENVIYLLGRYQPDSSLSIKNLQKMYRQMYRKLYAVPFEAEYMDANSNGSVPNYFISKINGHTEWEKQLQMLYKRIIKENGRRES